MSNIFSNLQAETEKQKRQLSPQQSPTPQGKSSQDDKPTLEPARESTHARDIMREMPREIPRNLPSRDEIQEFSFRLRDAWKVKVQAEVPHAWQKELEDLARQLDVKKLELYRFIIGEFLGKVRRESSISQQEEKKPK